jgi:hypothetical protein
MGTTAATKKAATVQVLRSISVGSPGLLLTLKPMALRLFKKESSKMENRSVLEGF